MREKSSALSKNAESIILERTNERLIDVVYRADNAEDYAKIAREKLGLFYENLVFSSLDLGVKGGKALDLGTQFGLCAISLAKQDYDFGITSFQDGVKLARMSMGFAEEDMADDRIRWVTGKHESLPFGNGTFDLVISGFDMHHWENPVQVFNEIGRVLKANGALLIADFRRDAFSPVMPLLKAVSYLEKKNKIYEEMRHSFAASYLKSEVLELLASSGLKGCEVSRDAQFFYVKKAREEKKHVLAEFSRP
jgi:ubiquinone/menaquinone biosynthesis C-methylase UbiE